MRRHIDKDKMSRTGRLNLILIVSCMCIFAVILLISVYTTYASNKNAHIKGLAQQAELSSYHMLNNIWSYGRRVLYLRSGEQFVELLDHKAQAPNGRFEAEQKIAEQIYISVGQSDSFYGVTLEDLEGTCYLQNTRLPTCDALVKRTVTAASEDFNKNKFIVSLCENENSPLLIITAPVKNGADTVLGYLHIVFNNKVFSLPDNIGGREGILFNTAQWTPIYTSNFAGLEWAKQRMQNCAGMIEGIKHAVIEEQESFTYKNESGEKMIASVYKDRQYPFALVLSIRAEDMIQLGLPYTMGQIVASVLLLLFLILILYTFTRRLNQPVSDMIEQCSRMAAGDETVSFEKQTDKELNRLADAFNSYRKKIERAAYIDPLLAIGNRGKAIRDIDLQIAEHRQKKFSLFLIDIREFSKYNDIFSITTGDHILEGIAFRLVSVFGNSLYRINGDVFLGISSGWDDETVCEKIHRQFETKLVLKEMELEIEYNMGICHYPEHGAGANELLEKTQSALGYAKKNAFPNTVIYNKEITQLIRREDEILSLLHRRIADHTLEIWYQPIYEISTGKFISAEALLRLKDDNGQIISPAQVISIAEKNNQVDIIGDYVLYAGCRILNRLSEIPNSIQNLHINLSVQQLIQPNYAQKVLGIIDEMNVHPEQIGMEVTETMLIQSFDSVSGVLTELKKAGIQIALDDFGSGYSSISYLSHLSLDTLKLDMELVRQITESKEQMELIQTVIQMAKIKHIGVVAEGVEDEETLEKITACGADYIQGYYYSKPLPEETFLLFVCDCESKEQ